MLCHLKHAHIADGYTSEDTDARASRCTKRSARKRSADGTQKLGEIKQKRLKSGAGTYVLHVSPMAYTHTIHLRCIT